MGVVVVKVPGGETTGVGVVNTSLAGHPIMVVTPTKGTMPGQFPHRKVGIKQQGPTEMQTSSSSQIGGVKPAGNGQVPMLRLALTAEAPGARSTVSRVGLNKIS